MVLYFFFFKQKTAYEVRISDWSSDVCSSDLAEVEQVHVAVVVDQHVGRLDVAVDHQVAVRVGRGVADLQVQPHDRAGVERVRVAPAVDALAVDQRHRQPAGAGPGHARVDQGGEVGKAEASTGRGLARERKSTRLD